MNTSHSTETIRYGRSYSLSSEAVHTLCCHTGKLKDRILQIDPEYFSLEYSKFPEHENIRKHVEELRALVTKFDPTSPYPLGGKVIASIEKSHYTKRIRMAELIWQIHRELSSYMQRDA